MVFTTNGCLMQVKSIAEYSKWSIQQPFRSSLSYHLPLRSLFCLFLSGCFTQVLRYQTRRKSEIVHKVLNLLMFDFQREYRKRGFHEVVTPNMYNHKLWEISGHWQHYAVSF